MPLTTVGTYSIERLQVLSETGRLDRKLEPALERGALVALYRAMALAREVDDRMLKLQRQGRIGTFPLCTGQEAAACGVVAAMRSTDWLVPAFREVGAMLMRGIPLEQVFALYAGFEEGNHNPQAPRTLPIAIPVGSQLPHAAGLAFAARALGEAETAVVVFLGDGATSEGDFHEAINFAGVWAAPVVFVCQNNGWAISLPRHEQTASATLAQKAIAYGVAGLQVDGNDVLAVYRATAEALDRARRGGGPTLIEAVTYRLLQHTTSDDPKKYRTDEEVEAWRRRDPIPRFRAYLEKKGAWDEARERAMGEEIKAEVDAAVARFEARAPAKPDAPFDHVLATPPRAVEEQRAEFLARAARPGRREAGHG
jgi:pyruvate dehydrogenase E1 component alpha subunit